MDKKRKRSRSPEKTSTERRDKKRYRVEAITPPALDINNYQLVKKLGEGSFGKVMLASYAIKKQHVALKIIEKEKEMSHKEIKTEAAILRLGRLCPFLIRAYATFQTESLVLYVMEYARGGTLHQLIKQKGYFRSHEVRFYSAEIVVGLQFLQEYGVVHRDLEPENILLNKEGHVKIADFGLACVHEFKGSKAYNGISGASGYMAPEVLANTAYNASADWWSFGVVVYEMATGKLPFSPDGTSKKQLETIMNREPYYPERVRPELCDFIKQLLKKDVKQRLGVCANVQDHPFLSSVNWRNVKKLRLEPPLKPRIKPIDRLSNIPFPVNNISGTCMIKDITYTDPTWKDK
ncbi:hypothetical protein XENTR_v10024554 [Xenopus tropicalis]|nr:hypothetical protein XENTR_v10024554 [Xenopus tropicalis]